ncbi:MAG: YggT family protein [Pseudomonadota bacterium]
MSAAFSQALILVVTNLGGIYIGAVIVRFLLQAARADFYNPICQAIVKATSPLLNPLRRIVPSWRRLDLASLVLALILASLATALMVFSTGNTLPIGTIVSWALVGLVGLTLNIYFWAMIVTVVASFIAPHSGHPILLIIYQLLQPFYKLAHRILPPMGGLDFSPLLLMLTIKVIEILVLGPLASGLRVAPQVVIGL